MQSPATLERPSSPFELTDAQRKQALVALVVVLVLLLGLGAALDRVTTQSKKIVGFGIPRAVPFPREVRDDFTRTDGARLPAASTGQRWDPIKGAWGEDGGTARVVAPDPISPSYALIRSGRGSGSVSFTATHVAEGMGIAFRCEDELNCWTLTARVQFGTWQLTKITGAQVIDMQNVGQVPIADGTRVRVETRPEGFDVYVNDVLARHVDSTELNDKGRSGLVLASGGDATARYGAFRTVQYDIVGPDAPIHDDFERARAGSSLGATPTGQRWQVASGSWGIQRGEAVLESQPSLKPAVATIDVGRSDGWVQTTASAIPTGTGLVFRYQDPKNYYRVSAVPLYGTMNVMRVVRGRETRIGSTGLTNFGNGSTIGVRLRADRVTVFVDGYETVTYRIPELRRAHRAGIAIDSPKAVGARFAGFAAGPASVAGTP
jgi:hypothetical protein